MGFPSVEKTLRISDVHWSLLTLHQGERGFARASGCVKVFPASDKRHLKVCCDKAKIAVLHC